MKYNYAAGLKTGSPLRDFEFSQRRWWIFEYFKVDAMYVAKYLPTFRGSLLPVFAESKWNSSGASDGAVSSLSVTFVFKESTVCNRSSWIVYVTGAVGLCIRSWVQNCEGSTCHIYVVCLVRRECCQMTLRKFRESLGDCNYWPFSRKWRHSQPEVSRI